MKKVTKTFTREVNVATLSDLEKFLEDNGALGGYVSNLVKQYTTLPRASFTFSTSIDVKKILVNRSLISKDFIIRAFTWVTSPEGSMYWMEIDNKFAEWCKANEIEAFEVE